jgi:hypothetical protein
MTSTPTIANPHIEETLCQSNYSNSPLVFAGGSMGRRVQGKEERKEERRGEGVIISIYAYV